MGHAYVPQREERAGGSPPVGRDVDPLPLGALISLSSLRLEDLIRTVRTAVGQVTGCDGPTVNLVDGDRGQIEVMAASDEVALALDGRPVTDLSPEVRGALVERRSRVIDFGSEHVSDVARARGEEFGLGRVLVVPLVVVDRSIGFITVRDLGDPGHEFTERQVALVEGIAAQAAVAIDNVRLYEDALEAARLNRALNEIDAELNEIADFEATLQDMLQVSAEALGCSSSAVTVVDGDLWRATHALGFPREVVGGAHPLSVVPHGLLALETRRPVVVEDAYADERVDAAAMERVGVRAVVTVPLQHGSDTFGVLYFNHSEPRRFSQNQVDFAAKLGAHVSLAWKNRRLLEEERRSARLSQALTAVNEILLTSLDTAEMLDRAVAEVAKAFQADASVVLMPEAGVRPSWRLRSWRGLEPGFEGVRLEGEAAEGVKAVVAAGAPAFFGDVRQDPRLARLLAGIPLGAIVLLPMPARDGLPRVLAFGFEEPQQFGEYDRELALRLSTALSRALDSARLYEEERERARLNERLASIDEALHSTMEFDEILTQALREGAAAVAAEAAAVLLHEGDQVRIVHSFGFPCHLDAGPIEGQMGIHQPKNPGEILAIEDVRKDDRCDPRHMTWLGVRALAAVPLVIRGEAAGSVYFDYVSGPHRFTPNELEFLRRFGSTLSLSLENAQAYEAEHRTAQTLQEALLALPEDMPGVDFAYEYKAASRNERVGGDFFDVFELEHGLLGVVIGDVSGKGLDAAVLTALVKNTIRAHAIVRGNTPAQVIRHVNEVLLKESRTETFVTVFFGILDRRDGRLVFCNAAHPAPFVLVDNGARRLKVNSPIAGAFREVTFVNSETQLAGSELLFLYTDGLTEARNGDDFYGEERLFVQLAHDVDLQPAATIRRALDDAIAFAGGRLSDDLAVLAIRRRRLPSRHPVQQKLQLWADRD